MGIKECEVAGLSVKETDFAVKIKIHRDYAELFNNFRVWKHIEDMGSSPNMDVLIHIDKASLEQADSLKRFNAVVEQSCKRLVILKQLHKALSDRARYELSGLFSVEYTQWNAQETLGRVIAINDAYVAVQEPFDGLKRSFFILSMNRFIHQQKNLLKVGNTVRVIPNASTLLSNIFKTETTSDLFKDVNHQLSTDRTYNFYLFKEKIKSFVGIQ